MPPRDENGFYIEPGTTEIKFIREDGHTGIAPFPSMVAIFRN